MKVLITGSEGYLGRKFIQKYHDDLDIIALVKRKDCRIFNDFTGIKLEKHDITKVGLSQLFHKHKPDVVMHLASIGLKESEIAKNAFDVNVYGTFNVVQACLETDTKLIFTSSREVYGNKPNKRSIAESSILNPHNTYGITKMLAESIILHAGRNYDLNYIILRITNVYGPDGQQGLNKIIKNAVKKNKVTIFGGEQKINPIYIDDVVKILKKSTNGKYRKEIFNVGSKETIKIKEFCKILRDVLSVPIEVKFKNLPKEVTFSFKPDITKMQKSFGITIIPLREGIEKTLELLIIKN